MSAVITVTMLDVLRPDLEEWLRGRGLALQDITAALDQDSEGMTAYVVVIPEGSPLEKYMSVPRAPRESNGTDGTFTTKDVREWARSRGYDVAPTGRLPDSLIDEYRRAQQS